MAHVQRAWNHAVVNHPEETKESRRGRVRADPQGVQEIGEGPHTDLANIRKRCTLFRRAYHAVPACEKYGRERTQRGKKPGDWIHG